MNTNIMWFLHSVGKKSVPKKNGFLEQVYFFGIRDWNYSISKLKDDEVKIIPILLRMSTKYLLILFIK